MLSPAEGEAFGSLWILQPVYEIGYDCRVMWLSTGNTELALPLLPWHALIYKRMQIAHRVFSFHIAPNLTYLARNIL